MNEWLKKQLILIHVSQNSNLTWHMVHLYYFLLLRQGGGRWQQVYYAIIKPPWQAIQCHRRIGLMSNERTWASTHA
jgi:hypothetical protein